MKEAGINPVDKPAGVAKFIQFLSGRKSSAVRIQDTTVYKKVKSPFNIKDELVVKDLQAIRPFFEEMELHQIVGKIDKEILHSQKSEYLAYLALSVTTPPRKSLFYTLF